MLSSRDTAVKNLNVKIADTESLDYGYGIVYSLASGVIDNCRFDGNLSGSSVGGIARSV